MNTAKNEQLQNGEQREGNTGLSSDEQLLVSATAIFGDGSISTEFVQALQDGNGEVIFDTLRRFPGVVEEVNLIEDPVSQRSMWEHAGNLIEAIISRAPEEHSYATSASVAELVDNPHATNAYGRAHLALVAESAHMKRAYPDISETGMVDIHMLLQYIPQDDITRIGEELKALTGKTDINLFIQRIQESAPGNTSRIIEAVVSAFVKTGHVKRGSNDTIQLTNKGKALNGIHDGTLLGVSLSHKSLRSTREDTEELTIEEIYKKGRAEQAITKLNIKLEGGNRILSISEVLIGNPHADIALVRDIIRRVNDFPEDQRPTLVSVTGLAQGDFKFSMTNKRGTLVPGLETMNAQFHHAQQLLEQLRSLGIPIIYNMGDDDRRLVRDYTVEVFRKMMRDGASAETDPRFLPYWEVNQVNQHEGFQRHFAFQNDVIYPYCLRTGRRLRTADEVSALTQGNAIEEYVLIFDAYNRLMGGDVGVRDLEPYRTVIDFDNIIPIGEPDINGVTVIDDANITISKKSEDSGDETSVWIRHNLNLGDVSVYQSHMSTPRAILGQLGANHRATPDLLITQHNQEAVGVGGPDNKWIVSTPAFIDPELAIHNRARVSSVNPPARRQSATRRRLSSPGATMNELTSDGRHKVSFMNRKLLEKADISADRHAVALMIDWQNGSVTARPDLQVLFTDYVMSEILPKNKLHILNGGDIIQGRNYPEMPNENQHLGLIRMATQQAFVKEFLEKALTGVERESAQNLEGVMTILGNHEWNSRHKENGAAHYEYLHDMYSAFCRTHGLNPARVSFSDTVVTRFGDFFKSWTAFNPDIAGYGVMLQHMPLERGAKGGGGDLPIYQALTHAMGVGNLVEDVDAAFYGHWHHPQYLMHGDKIAVISPSIAGLSGFEWDRGHRPVIGAVCGYFGGGLPPQVEFLSERTLYQHRVRNGYYAPENLAHEGFHDDRHVDMRRAFADPYAPKTALQKAIWSMIETHRSAERTRTYI